MDGAGDEAGASRNLPRVRKGSNDNDQRPAQGRPYNLLHEIEQTERLVIAYREAERVVITTSGQSRFNTGPENRVELTTAEIGDQIVMALEQRVATMRASLRDLGVE
jgi:hypothetical protein